MVELLPPAIPLRRADALIVGCSVKDAVRARAEGVQHNVITVPISVSRKNEREICASREKVSYRVS